VGTRAPLNRDRENDAAKFSVTIAVRLRLSLEMLTPDQEALRLLERGDFRGFDLAYARYAEPIFGFLVRLCGSRALAEDLFQHTFLRLAEAGPRLRVDSNLRAWLFTVARNAFHSHARSRKLEACLDGEQLATLPASVGSPDANLELVELERALAAMSEADRELLLLFGVEGLSHAELSEVLALDPVTVRKRVSRARARLAEALDEDARVMSKSEVSE
jgi:RNA polymerase sigma-70 factor (ECF subfamily)